MFGTKLWLLLIGLKLRRVWLLRREIVLGLAERRPSTVEARTLLLCYVDSMTRSPLTITFLSGLTCYISIIAMS